MMDRRCDRCHSFKQTIPTHNESFASRGECRRAAPVPGRDIRNPWPTVDGDEWCGEFQQGSALSQHLAVADTSDTQSVYTCMIHCLGCGKESKVEHSAAFGLRGFHCCCGQYTKATP